MFIMCCYLFTVRWQFDTRIENMGESEVKSLFRCMVLMSGMHQRLVSQGKIDGIFVWGRADDEYQPSQFDEGVLNHAAELFRLTKATVYIPGYIGSECGQGENGHPGPVVWTKALRDLSVPSNRITPVSGGGHNAKTEFNDLLTLASQNGLKIVIGVSQVTHILRAMLGAVKSMNDTGIQIVVIPAYPTMFDFGRSCHGSQGEGPFPRTEWVDKEYDRIPEYLAQGDMATLSELDEYLTMIHEMALS